MEFERTKNTKRNIVFGLISNVVVILVPFYIRTLLIKNIGADVLGFNSLVSSILQVLNMTELGFSSAVVFCMYKPVAEDDNETICSILNFYKQIYFFIGIFILLVGCCIAPFLKSLVKGDLPKINIYIVYFIYLVNTVLSYLLFSYRNSIILAYQRNDIVSKINLCLNLIVYSLQIFVLLQFKNFYLYLLLLSLSTIANNIIIYVITRRKFPTITPKGKLSNETKKTLIEKMKGLLLIKISGVSRNALDSIYLSAFLGLVSTAVYNNYYYVMNGVMGFLGIISSSMLAGVGNSIVTESVDKNYDDLEKFNFIYMWISGWCSVCMLSLYQPFMELFFGKDMLFSFFNVILICLYFYCMSSAGIIAVYSNAIGLWWEARYVVIAETVGNLILNFVLGRIYGVSGIISATLISMFFTTLTFGTYVVFKKYFRNKKMAVYFLKHLLYFVVTLIISIITVLITYNIKKNTYLTFCFKIIICLFVPNVLYFLFYFRLNEFKKAKELFFRRK